MMISLRMLHLALRELRRRPRSRRHEEYEWSDRDRSAESNGRGLRWSDRSFTSRGQRKMEVSNPTRRSARAAFEAGLDPVQLTFQGLPQKTPAAAVIRGGSLSVV